MSTTLSRFSRLTPARVRLDASAGPLPMEALLRFQEDHAAAQDAIWSRPDWAALQAALPGRQVFRVKSQVRDRAEYLRRPDLGRQLSEDSAVPRRDPGLILVVADGLSAPAISRHAVPLIEALGARLPEAAAAPVFLAEYGRVALGDPIGQAAGADLCLTLIGERPGLSVSDSLGAYLTMAPRAGLRDSARNCVSNIHDHGGLSYAQAADRLAWLIAEARKLGATGVALKDDSAAEPALLSQTPPA